VASAVLPPYAVVCDFDGTITTFDLGDRLGRRFSPPERWAEVEARYRAGGQTLREILRSMFAPIRATEAELAAAALELGEIRDGFAELVADCVGHALPFVLASGGIDLYIDPVLRSVLPPAHDAHVERRCNRATVRADGLDVVFPLDGQGCGTCGSCKRVVVEELRARGVRTVIAVGDGVSDRCLVGSADVLFARGHLLDYARRHGADALPWEDFHDVRRWIAARL
jgi:2-hydroxy-3-keto-5-methylthiopentenyl-1-phosphate phosphatase